MIQLTGMRRMIVRLLVATAARIVAGIGGALHFDTPDNSGLLGAL